jgi:anhydro-N-acetylmuramic acid kinase
VALRALATAEQDDLDALGAADAQAGDAFADATLALLATAGIGPAAVHAVGSHGQTVRHRPAATPPFTIQIGDPNRIAERTGITTVADFRRRDVAAGGQGAPLVPAFHAAAFREPGEDRAVLNVGGIANLTLLPAGADETIAGFDTGPGNCLMDAWVRTRLGVPFDEGGRLAAQGSVLPDLLHRLGDDPYLAAPPPKSTGPEHFSIEWLESRLTGAQSAVDVLATLTAFTAQTIAAALRRSLPACRRLIVCGGGTHNTSLVGLLRSALPSLAVESSAKHGVAPDWVEAIAFAWLASRTLERMPGNVPSVTGARRPVVLGAIYPP